MRARAGSVLLAGAMVLSIFAAPIAAEDACHAVLADRMRACTEACIAHAKAAVAPEIRDRITGRGCANNCTKLEMFNGHSCP